MFVHVSVLQENKIICEVFYCANVLHNICMVLKLVRQSVDTKTHSTGTIQTEGV